MGIECYNIFGGQKVMKIIERVYLNEQTLDFNENAPKLREQLASLYSLLLRYSEEV